MKTYLHKIAFISAIICSTCTQAQKTTLSKNWTSLLQKIEVNVDKPTKFKFTGWVKVLGHDQDSTVKAGLWARVDNKDNDTGFFDNMDNRPITSNEWQEYEIIGTMYNNANILNIGGLVYYNGTFYFDNFKLYIEDKNGVFQPVELKNADFEDKEILKDWKSTLIANNSLAIKNFTFDKASDAQSGNQSLQVIGKNITKPLPEELLKNWYQKDYKQDAIPGISLAKAYNELLANRKGEEVVVAVLDTKLDIHHEDIKDRIWINTDEIPDNGIDDDNNGYVDDINGWDFLSNTKGEFVKYQHIESTRIVKAYDSIFKNKTEDKIPNYLKKEYQLYTKAIEAWNKEVDSDYQKTLKNFNYWKEILSYGKHLLDSIYPKEAYTIEELDSLYLAYKNNSLIQYKLKEYRDAIKYNLTEDYLDNYTDQIVNTQEKMLNPEYNERAIPGDDVTNIDDRYYGSPVVYGDVPFQHATVVAGILGATRSNTIGIKGFTDHIKLMPVVMVASGDENDKDVALAIRYAVDNGAKIINMSWGKNLSLNEQWVNEAIRYAADKDVLLVTAAGNEDNNNDTNKYYLNDYINEKEFVDNFIVVGASTWDMQNLKASFSNYGTKHVDIFAPGVDMYTTQYGKDKYTSSEGTSLASPVVAGVAALLRAYYPKLTAKQVKQIILNSGTPYEVNITMASSDGKDINVPFSELSKSGKIVNAYNALLMAEELSKK